MGSFIDLTAADGHKFRAYAAGSPDQSRGLVLCHEYNGLNRAIRRQADRLAAMGFSVIAPDLFDRVEPGLELGYMPSQNAHGRAVAAQIAPEQTLMDVSSAAEALGQPDLAIMGFDWGATVAWHAASQLPGLRAAVCYYGDGIADARQETPLCPTQLHFAEFDRHIPAIHVEAIRRAQPQADIELYSGAAHGFVCDEQESFNFEASETARDNTLAFLKRHMDLQPLGRRAA